MVTGFHYKCDIIQGMYCVSYTWQWDTEIEMDRLVSSPMDKDNEQALKQTKTHCISKLSFAICFCLLKRKRKAFLLYPYHNINA